MTTDPVGGVWTYALELAHGLRKHDVEVTLAVMGPRMRPDQRAEVSASHLHGVHEFECALEWMERPWADVDRAGSWLLRIADEVNPDVVHLNSYAHAALDWDVPVVVVGHSDVLSWHEAVRGEPAGREWQSYRRVVEAGIRSADLLVTPTQAMLDELVRLYEPQCPQLVIPNSSARGFPRGPKERLILTVGRIWDEAKNVQALVRVAPRLSWPVAVAGAGSTGSSLSALGVLDRQQMDSVFGAAAVFAEPAHYEPFGLAALEAGRAGCALVLGDIPSLREVWGDSALFVPPNDEDELERCLRALIDEPRLRAIVAERACARALTYSTERTADAYADALRSVLQRDPVWTS